MNTSEKFCLEWNDYTQNIGSTFADLRAANDFSDVTLACEDGKQIQAHKIVLSAGSHFFKNILKNRKDLSPIVFMRGIKRHCLEAILDFLYLGEVNIMQDDLNEFLQIAEELQLKGLVTSSKTSEEQPIEKSTYPEVGKEPKKVKYNVKKTLDILEVKHEYEGPGVIEEEPIEQSRQVVTLAETAGLAQKMEEFIERSEGGWSCTVCGKQAKRRNNLMRHSETHMDGLSYPCNECGKDFRCSANLKNHKYRSHKSV